MLVLKRFYYCIHKIRGLENICLTVKGTLFFSRDLNELIKKQVQSTTRHLRGNWLAYWDHEVGRPDHSDPKLDLKQIPLQTFTGHTSAVKSVYVLDNENSFLSGSKDKTVKVWSLRSQGDGAATCLPQWTYNLHKKPVQNVLFLESLRLAVSSDSNVHFWDPFVGSCVQQVDGLGPVSTVVPLANHHAVLCSTNNDGSIHIIDSRATIKADFRVSMGSAGLLKSMCVSGDGRSVCIGHSTGFISQMDLRTGRLRQSWKGHEGEILTLTPLHRTGEFVSSSLDQTMTIWTNPEAKFKCNLAGIQEPIYCVAVYGEQIIAGSNTNRVTVRYGSSADSHHIVSKLKPEVMKSPLTSVNVLPMNRLLLIGQDSGNIRLVC